MTPAPRQLPSHRRSQSRPAVAPRGPRRVSGPVTRRMVAAPAAGAALPRRGTTGLFARIRALPEHRVIDRLLRSRLWIWALGALLGGIVAMQVSLLKLNSGISRAVETTSTLERQNAGLETTIARLSAPERIHTGANALNMVHPPAGDVGWLTAGPQDAQRAAGRMEPPSDAAKQLLANGGIEPGSLAAPLVGTDPTVAPTGTPTAPTTTTAPATATEAPVAPASGAAAPAPAATETAPAATETAPAATETAPAATETAPTSQQPPPTSQASPAGGAVAGQG